MKKAISLMLALLIVSSLSVSAFAAGVGSIVATETTEKGDKASALPTMTEELDYVVLTPADEAKTLSAEAQEEMKEAQSEIEEAVPEGMEARNFFYSESTKLPYTLTIKMEDIKDEDSFVCKLFIDGKWVEMEYVINDDGTISITITANGPAVLCTAID